MTTSKATVLLRDTRKTDRARGRNTPVFLNALAPRGAAFALLLSISVLWSADTVSGDWTWKMSSPNGEVEARLTLKQDGEKPTGASEWSAERK